MSHFRHNVLTVGYEVFQIPMRGNESLSLQVFGDRFKFQIPMRGNEFLGYGVGIGLLAGFQIPMRGNELANY